MYELNLKSQFIIGSVENAGVTHHEFKLKAI